jgi:2,4-dienoyl-CoA reductase-like NADH-dependent reductase (Old Yellow Enzyme family)
VKKHVPDVFISAVGDSADAEQAEEILRKGRADVVHLRRELFSNTDFPLNVCRMITVTI